METIIGHAEMTAAFDGTIARGQLAHAYLLAGPPGVGKLTIARWCASRVLCADAHAPCGVCPSCAQVARGVHPDVMIVGGAAPVTVDAVRGWTSAMSASSLLGGWKVGILEGVDGCTEEAANALLKTIEEPTPRTVLFLTAARAQGLLPTIASRCATVPCRRVPYAVLRDGLLARGCASEDADRFAIAADGCPGIALAWTADPELRALAAEHQRLAWSLITGSYTDRLRSADAFIRRLPDDRAVARDRVRNLIATLRSATRLLVERAVDIGGAPGAMFQTILGDALGPIPRVSVAMLVPWMRILARAGNDLAANVTPRLIIETLAIAFP
jgi:DNA polymerase-3 subunit delta'